MGESDDFTAWQHFSLNNSQSCYYQITKTADFTGFFDCFPVIKTHIAQYVFYTVKKFHFYF